MDTHLSPRRSRTRALLVLLFLFGSLVGAVPGHSALAAVPQPANAQAALDWLRTQQLPDGSFAAFGGAGDAGATADAVLAFTSAGIDPRSARSSSGVSAIDFLLTSAASTTTKPGLAAKVALALHSAALNPRDAGGVDLIVAIDAGFQPDTGRYDPSFFSHLLAVLALRAAGSPVQPAAIDAIIASQIEDGSWGFTGDIAPGTGDSNTTALAIQALVALGAGEAEIDAGLAYLRSLQDAGGAVAYDATTLASGGDANSTALAIQAFVAAGEDPSALPGGDLLAALLSFQNESGAFQYQPAFPDDSLLATVQAIPALLLRPFPLDPIAPDSPLVEAVKPVAPLDGCDYHDVTGHNVCGLFRDYWRANGGLANFGYALSEEYEEFGTRVQYFERARFEWHPEFAGTPHEVLLTRLGQDVVDRSLREQSTPVETRAAGCDYDEITRHNLCGGFAAFWRDFGGLAVFGRPLTEEFRDDGMTVQYFERARFEWHPGVWPERYDVLLGRLGAEAAERELAR